MKQKHLTFLICLISFPLCVKGQWKLGVTGGATLNQYTIDKQYMENVYYKNEWGGTAGVSALYDFLQLKDWKFGVRGDINWMMKDYRESLVAETNSFNYFSFIVMNHFIQMPIMANITFGKKLRCIGNIGCYGSYWLSCIKNGYNLFGRLDFTEMQNIHGENYHVNFDSQRDNRFECGIVTGIGGEWQFCKLLSVQIQALWYHGITSTQKEYMRIKSPRYNDTLVLQAGLYLNL